MGLKQTIEEMVEKHLPDKTHFVVDVHIVEGPQQRVKVLIDADSGLNINTCAAVSRALGEEIEAKELLPEAYVLEVSSPGLDYPLVSRRQYEKNIGRSLKVTMKDSSEIEGVLSSVGLSSIVLKVKKKEKGKKSTEEELTADFEQIRKSIVLVSFK